MATALKRIKKHPVPAWFKLFSLTSSETCKKPWLGLGFHSDILNSKYPKIQKKVFLFSLYNCESFKFIHFTS